MLHLLEKRRLPNTGTSLEGPATETDRSKYLLLHATALALEGAFKNGQDMPVGAVLAAGNMIVGGYFACDNKRSNPLAHAEFMANRAWILGQELSLPKPETVVVNLEPCRRCQDYLANMPWIRRVGFGLERSALTERGLLMPSKETILDRATSGELPYEAFQIEDDVLRDANEMIFDNTIRDPQSGQVAIDVDNLSNCLINDPRMSLLVA